MLDDGCLSVDYFSWGFSWLLKNDFRKNKTINSCSFWLLLIYFLENKLNTNQALKKFEKV